LVKERKLSSLCPMHVLVDQDIIRKLTKQHEISGRNDDVCLL
jgi:hypothetical protein